MRATRLTVASLLAAVATTGVVAATVAATGRSTLDDLAIALAVMMYAAVGLAIELARPGHPVGRLMLAGSVGWGVGEGLLALGVTGLASDPSSSGLVIVGVAGSATRGLGWLLLILVLPLVFPDGRAPGRGATGLVAGCLAAFFIASLIAPVPLEDRLAETENPIGVPDPWGPAADVLAVGAIAASFVALAIAVRALVGKWHAEGDLVRQQIIVFGVAFALPLAVLPIVATPWGRPWVFALVTLPVPAAVAVAMFQRRLYDAQRVARRSLTYLALSAVLAGLYALIVGGVGVMLRDRGTPWLPWAAAGVVAVAFAPLREWLQRGVNQLTYGRWSAPAEVLAETGRRLADAADARSLLTTLTEELVAGLGLTRAEIHDARGQLLAATGPPRETTASLPLAAYGQGVGSLRWAGPALRPAHHALLADLAHQVGAAVHTAGLVDSLSRARDQLVRAREQERRRLRRDLHDGLGPALAGLGLHVDATQNLLAAGQPADAQLQLLRRGLDETVSEVRRVVDGLRPPALDELGLTSALAELARELIEGAGLGLALDLPAELPGLPAAVEVAAYRIAQESLTNIVRHSGAASCRVTGCVAGDVLVLTVADDGRGGAEPGPRVGLGSMAERALEIGGAVHVTSDGSGTTVTARLPVHQQVVS